MGHHQHSPSSQQYDNQRNFSSTGANRHIYFDSPQSRTLSRVLHRQPPFYHHQHHHHHHQQQHQQLLQQQQPPPPPHQHQPHFAYRARLAQLQHGQTSVIGSHPYGGDPYGSPYDDDSIGRHSFVPMQPPSRPEPPPPPPSSYQPYQQHVQPKLTSFEQGQQVYLQQDSNEADQLAAAYYQNEFLEPQQQQQQEPLGDYVTDTYAPQVVGYRDHTTTFTTRHQLEHDEQPEMMIQPRRRLSISQNHQHFQDMYQASHQPSFTNMNNYFIENPRVGPRLSDEQVHHYGVSPKRPVQTILVPSPSSIESHMCYPRATSDSHYNPASSSNSNSSSAGLPLRTRHLIMDNGQVSSPLYDAREDRLAQTRNERDLNTPYSNQTFDAQQTETSPSSILSSEPEMIASSTAQAPRDSADTNERSESLLAAAAAVAAETRARSRADSRQINNVQYGQDINNFNGVYNYNNVTKTRQQPSTLQQCPERFQQPFSNASESSTLTSNGKNQRRVIEDDVKKNLLVSPTNENTRHLSSYKSSAQEYSDMGTGGNVSQDWLDTICGHLIEHMDNFGICVIDNFLGSIKGELILKEVHRLYSIGRYSKGKLVSNKLSDGVGNSSLSTAASDDSSSSSSPASVKNIADNMIPNDKRLKQQPPPQQQQQQQQHQPQARLQGAATDATGAIRNDRVIWVDGCEDDCTEINNLIQTLCSVITNSSRLSLYSNNGLDKVNINRRTKAHVACYPGTGTRYIKHVDNPNGDGRVITAIYYLNKNWNTKRDGGLLRMFPAGMDEVANIEPLFDRALFFWSDRRNPHEVLPSFRDRFAITVWYLGETRQ